MRARPPGVTSGLPKTMPTFSRNWLMKMTAVRERLMAADSLRIACDMSRACRPGRESPMSPSISARGTSAATESMTMTSTALERTSASVISSACSPVSGCDTSRSSILMPQAAGVRRVESVLDVDVGGGAAQLLRFGDDVLRERRLAGGLRPEYLRHPAARNAADAERYVEGDRAGRDGLHLQVRRRLAEAHDGALAERFLDVADGQL